MRYLVRARVKPGREEALVDAIDSRTLGQGSIAGDEYLRNMNDARQFDAGTLCWVEVCCRTRMRGRRAREREMGAGAVGGIVPGAPTTAGRASCSVGGKR